MRILFSGHRWGDLTDRLEASLPDCEIVHHPVEELLHHLKGIDVIIPAMARITKEIIDAAPDLKLIQQAGVGLEGVDIAAATRKGVPVANVPSLGSGNAESVAELAVLHMLVLLRKYHAALANFQGQVWGQPLGSTLYGKTVGIIGVGRIGRSMARIAGAGFGARVLGYDPHVSAEQMRAAGVHKCDRLHEMLAECDFVSIHCVLNEATRGLIGEPQFAAMKPGAVLINVSRGALVDEGALLRALQGGRLGGAGLDVFSQEPLALAGHPLSPLFGMDNVLLTPHLTFFTREAMQRLQDETLQRCDELLAGQPVLVKSRDPRLASQQHGVRFD